MPEHRRNPAEGAYAAAIDIGTTTVAVSILDLRNDRAIATVAAQNPQTALGADVVGRIGAALAGCGPLLKRVIQNTVAELIGAACAACGVNPELVVARVITGNTTMLYLYTGRDPEPLSHAPFRAVCLFGITEGTIYYPPCFGAFVGADIACAVLASGMTEKSETSMLIDLGTNGEIALWHEGRLHCCATAAGPAFEGGGIGCGSLGVPGAIDRVSPEGEGLVIHTIGDERAKSLCGSGLIDAVAAMRKLGWIDETGAAEREPLPLAEGVVLTGRDIRQVQLAKAAIAAGMETLMRCNGLCASDIGTLYIAGGFGQFLPLHSAAAIGLLPKELLSRTVVLGNAALSGAALLLLDIGQRDALKGITAQANCINLAADPIFTEAYIERMMFEDFEG